jgi:hypothetical protein
MTSIRNTFTSQKAIMKRRTFLRTVAGLAASTAIPHFAIAKPGKSANGKLNIAFIGSGGWIAQQARNRT